MKQIKLFRVNVNTAEEIDIERYTQLVIDASQDRDDVTIFGFEMEGYVTLMQGRQLFALNVETLLSITNCLVPAVTSEQKGTKNDKEGN